MKKYVGIFFVTMVLTVSAALNASGGSSFSDALKNGTVNGEFKIWYQTNDRDPNSIFNKKNSIFDAGFNLGYKSGSLNGFSFRVNFYAIDDLKAYDRFANKSVHGVANNDTATWLGHAYISYEGENTLVNVGRQDINTPLIDSDGWAVFTNNFSGIYMQNTVIADTTIIASFVNKERRVNSSRFEDLGDDGAFIFGMVNRSIQDTVLKGYYYHYDDVRDVNALYLEASTKLNMINLAGQYMLFRPDGIGTKNTNAFGFKVSSKVGPVDLSGAFSSVSRGTLLAAKFSDNSIKTPLFTQTISGDGDITGATDSNSFLFSIGGNPIENLNITASYGRYRHGANSSAIANHTTKSHEVTARYTGFKNITIFSAFINSDHMGVGAWCGDTAGDSLNSWRLWASYKF